MNPDNTPHETNPRAPLMDVLIPEVIEQACLFGFEQEYTMLAKGGHPYGWPAGGGYPAPQGPFYCAVGSESVYGRDLAEVHMDACIKAGLTISGINAEVMPGQWEFQIGPAGPLETGDEVMLARWLLYRYVLHRIPITFAPCIRNSYAYHVRRTVLHVLSESHQNIGWMKNMILHGRRIPTQDIDCTLYAI